MKTQFDKVYIISLISNKDRQEFIKYQMKELDINFEFIYGIDFYNLKHDRFNNEITYPDLIDWDVLNNDKIYGCTLCNYKAILQAYEFGYNNILIIEDDTCFIKDKDILNYYLNNIPDDCDFITFTPRFINDNERHQFIKLSLLYQDNKYIKLNNKEYSSLCGTGMYGIMNRKTMKLYLENQRKNFNCCDHIKDIFEYPSINRYTTFDAICLDQYNEKNNGCCIECYIQNNFVKNYNLYYKPNIYNLSNIHNEIN